MKHVELLTVFLILVPLTASAQTPVWCPPDAECATSMVGACDDPGHLDAVSVLGTSEQTMCVIRALSLPVDATGSYRICYTVYGNATTKRHDGVNIWVSGPPDEPFLDVQVLPPRALGTYPSSTGVTGCQDVQVDAPFTATVKFAFYNKLNFRSPNQRWGARAPKLPVPSWLTIEKLQ